MDSLQDLLSQYSPNQPDEVLAIKRFIEQHFQSPSSVRVQDELLIVTVNSAPLANMLRLRIVELKKAVGTTKRIMFRIG